MRIKELFEIEKTLISADLAKMSPVDLSNFLLAIASYKATVNEMLPSIKKMKDEKTAEVIKKESRKLKDMSAMLTKIFIEGATATENELYNRAISVNSTIERMSESIRSSLKFLSEEMRMQK